MNPRIRIEKYLSCIGYVSLSEKNKKSAYTTAFDLKKRLVCAVKIPRQLAAKSVFLAIKNETFSECEKIPLTFSGIEGLHDVYSAELLPDKIGVYFYRIEIYNADVCIVSRKKGYYGEVRFECGCDSPFYDLQFTVSDFSYPVPEWIYGSTIYHIFVDRFKRKGNAPIKEGAILNEDWENGIPEFPEKQGGFLRNNVFFGGNLDGIIEKLDYISSLGVGCIYLSPIFEADSNHRYDTGDYMKIDSLIGDENTFKKLIKEAAKRNIKIILDGVFNHTGADSIYFNKYGNYASLGAYQSKKSPYYDWYFFKEHPDNYEAWWGIGILPKLNLKNRECREYFLAENGVIDKYARMGIGGFRLDVADELESDFIEGIKSRLSENSSGSILYGEVWEDASNKIAYGTRRSYYLGSQLDGAMNYPLRRGIIDFLRYADEGALRYALCEVMPNTPKRIRDSQMNLLGTHDTERIITALSGPSQEGMTNEELSRFKMSEEDYKRGKELLKLAYTILATVEGVPAIFYGDEAGLQGYSDPFNRMPFPWHNVDEEILSFYREIGALRKKEKLYKNSYFKLIYLDNDLLIFERYSKKNALVTLVNRSGREYKIYFQGEVRALYGEAICGSALTLKERSASVIKTKTDTKIKIL